jgi:mannose-6-phosphate isomerase-like protein (cupin superfamily)
VVSEKPRKGRLRRPKDYLRDNVVIKDLDRCREFIAGDGSILRELLNPLKEDLDIRYSLARARVMPGRTTLPHRLKAAEVYYIIQGAGQMCVQDEAVRVCCGQAVYVPPGAVQSIRNTGDDDLVFLCIVDPAWRPEDEELVA